MTTETKATTNSIDKEKLIGILKKNVEDTYNLYQQFLGQNSKARDLLSAIEDGMFDSENSQSDAPTKKVDQTTPEITDLVTTDLVEPVISAVRPTRNYIKKKK